MRLGLELIDGFADESRPSRGGASRLALGAEDFFWVLAFLYLPWELPEDLLEELPDDACRCGTLLERVFCFGLSVADFFTTLEAGTSRLTTSAKLGRFASSMLLLIFFIFSLFPVLYFCDFRTLRPLLFEARFSGAAAALLW